MLRIVTPWDSQPQEAVGVDLSRFPAPAEVWLPGISPLGLAKNSATTTSGTSSISATADGLGWTPGSNGRHYPAAVGFSGASRYAWIVAMWRDNTPFATYSVLRHASAAVPVQEANATLRGAFWPGGAVQAPEYKSGYDPKNKLSICAGRGIAGVGGVLYSNFGVPVSFANASALSTSTNAIVLGATEGGAEIATPYKILLAAAWNGAIPSDYQLERMASSMSEAYQLFAPRTIWVPVSSASSGTSFTITPSGGISFGGTSVDVKGKILTVSGGVTFSGTGSATFASGGTTYTITPTGGLVFAGSGVSVNSKVFLPSGGITFGGSGLDLRTKIIDIGGGVSLGGTGNMTSNTSTGPVQSGERTKVGVGT